MSLDHSNIADRYSSMTAEEFASIDRADLAEWARPYYDAERGKREPSWRYEEPQNEREASDFIELQTRLNKRHKTSNVLWKWIIVGVYIVAFLVLPSQDWPYVVVLFALVYGVWQSSVQANARRTGYILVWLRRFHRREHRAFQRILEEACAFTCIPITVQDSSFRSSSGMANVRLGDFMWYGIVLLIILAFLPMSLITVGVFSLSLAILLIPILISGRLGYIKLSQANAQIRARRLFEDIRNQKGNRAGVVILKCEDGFWRDVVSSAIQHADAIVVDVTEPSDNVFWELRTGLESRGPEKFVLACATDKSERSELSPATRSDLQAAIGEVPLEKFATYFYPRSGRMPWDVSYTKVHISDLRETLTKCIANVGVRQPVSTTRDPAPIAGQSPRS